MSDASHELRTPLTALQAMNEVALRRKKSPTQKRVNLRRQMSLKRRNSYPHHFPTWACNERQGTYNVKPVDIQAAVADAMSYAVGAASEHIEVEDKLPAIRITTDSEKLVHVVRIPLDNAVKYSNKNGKVVIAAKELPPRCA